MPTKRKRGRPRLPEGSSRGERLICRMTQADIQEIEAAARAAQLTKSDWVRETLVSAARARK